MRQTSVIGSLPELDLDTDEQVSWEGKQTLHLGDSLAGGKGSQSEPSRSACHPLYLQGHGRLLLVKGHV